MSREFYDWTVDDNLRFFIVWLYKYLCYDIDDIGYALQKPWKYQEEWEEFKEYQRKEDE